MITYLTYWALPEADKLAIIGIGIFTLIFDLVLLAIIYELLKEINMGTLLLGAIIGYLYARNQETVNQWLRKKFNTEFGS